MEVNKRQTAPLSQPGQSGARSPEMAAFLSELSPQTRQEMMRLQGAIPAFKGSPLDALLSNTEAGAKVMKAHFEDLAKSAPTDKLATLFKQAADAVLGMVDIRKAAQRMQATAEQAKAAALLKLVLEEEELLATLQKIRFEDIQASMDLLKLAQRELDAMQLNRITVEQLVASGLVVAVTAPVAAKSKLEGVADGNAGQRLTVTDAKADERISALDPLKAMQAMASQMALDDFS